MASGILATIALIAAFIGGAVIPVQAGLNARLAQALGTPLWASLVSFTVGTLVLLPLAMLARSPGAAFAGAGGAPWWAWVGDFLGACFVTITVFSAPIVGATAMIAAVIAGQLIAALLLDQFGWAGFAAQPLGWRELVGVVLLVAGVAMIRWGRG